MRLEDRALEVKVSENQLFFMLPEEKKLSFVLFQKFAIIREPEYDWETSLRKIVIEQLSPPEGVECDASFRITEKNVHPDTYETMYCSVQHALFLGYCVITPLPVTRKSLLVASPFQFRARKEAQVVRTEDV